MKMAVRALTVTTVFELSSDTIHLMQFCEFKTQSSVTSGGFSKENFTLLMTDNNESLMNY